MKLWLVAQKENDDYDTYDAFVVAAPTEEAARKIVPLSTGGYGDWAFTLEAVQVTLLGTAQRGITAGTILGSYNAG